MLIEERLNEILKIVNSKGSITVQELMKHFKASESTIRRDLNTLDENGQLVKVHGGAVALKNRFTTKDPDISARKEWNTEQKAKIGRYAAGLVEPHDFIYIDAGTTTEQMTIFIKEQKAVYVTNALGHARNLARAGCVVYLIGGEFKASTEAIVGEEAMASLEKYNFTKGFFGTNGITIDGGFTTPEIKEAMLKKCAIGQCKEVYVLADKSKFEKISSVKFAGFEEAMIITSQLEEEKYQQFSNIKEVSA